MEGKNVDVVQLTLCEQPAAWSIARVSSSEPGGLQVTGCQGVLSRSSRIFRSTRLASSFLSWYVSPADPTVTIRRLALPRLSAGAKGASDYTS